MGTLTNRSESSQTLLPWTQNRKEGDRVRLMALHSLKFRSLGECLSNRAGSINEIDLMSESKCSILRRNEAAQTLEEDVE